MRKTSVVIGNLERTGFHMSVEADMEYRVFLHKNVIVYIGQNLSMGTKFGRGTNSRMRYEVQMCKNQGAY